MAASSGPDSQLNGLKQHPVVHVAYCDVEAYAKWAGREIPTEAEWEFAARGGLEQVEYARGDELTPGGRGMANYWQGEFPWQNLLTDGYERTSPIGTYPANGYGLHDMIGNVWEWTTDWYQPRHPGERTKACCVPANPRGGEEQDSYDLNQPAISAVRRAARRLSFRSPYYICGSFADSFVSRLNLDPLVRVNVLKPPALGF